MLILALDTAGVSGSIALLRGEQLLELVPLAGGTYSAQLMPQVSALLARHHIARNGLDAYAVASGPGSFTGLRVGLSTVKALAEVTQKPIASVSLLEAMAWAAAEEGQVIAVLDAMRGQVFVGEYAVRRGEMPKLLREVLLTVIEFAAETQAGAVVPILTSDTGIAAAMQERGHTLQLVPRPRSDVIARLGALKIAHGQTISPEALDANYIRRSDAEIFAPGGS
jgi:tRNA threonylcarbamoyladenosine biosynthesis protein TsaB